jgi:hypothetical protein
MALVSVGTVRRRLGDLSADRFVAFVVTLWSARGAETTVVSGEGVVEARRGGQHRRLRPVVGRRVPAEARDDEILVLARPASAVRGVDDHGGRVVDADDLHAMLLYAVPRSEADDLCRRFFDRPLVADSPGKPVTARVPEYSAPLVVGLLGVALLVVGVFGGPTLYGDDAAVFGAPDSVGAGASVETPTDEPTSTAIETSAERGPYPPGLGPDGVIDANTLADTHAKAMTGQSYRWTITHREYVDGRPNAYRRETVYVASSTEYRTELEGAGDLRRADLVVAGVEVYADGETRYERQPIADEFEDSYTVDPAPVQGVRNGEDAYADRAERYLEWYLSVSESAVVDSFEREGTRYYWVRLGRDPYPGVENSSGSALVDENGVVHELRRQYDVPGEPGVSAVVSLRYTDVGSTTVEPPAWYEAEYAGTAAIEPTTPTETAGTPLDCNGSGGCNETTPTTTPPTPLGTPTPTPTPTSA